MSERGSCWQGYVQKGMKKKGNRMVSNCVPAGGMKRGELKKWFQEKWVDIGAPKKNVASIRSCAKEIKQVLQRENIQNAYPLQKPHR
jgi:hypothetical protein